MKLQTKLTFYDKTILKVQISQITNTYKGVWRDETKSLQITVDTFASLS